jgi:hypothetical protein
MNNHMWIKDEVISLEEVINSHVTLTLYTR